MGFYDRYPNAFEDFLSALDALSNVRLRHQIIDPVTFERYLRIISYDLKKTSLNYDLVFSHRYSYCAEPVDSFTISTDCLLDQILIC